MNEEQVIAINYTKNIFFFFLFPFFYGFVVSICLTFGWITSIMLGYKLKSHIFYQSGIFYFAGIAFIGSLFVCLPLQLYGNIFYSFLILLLFVCGGMFAKE